MSASDLVPRVVLFVTDLEQENAELKSQLKEQEDKQLLVQITGHNRTPIHFKGSLKNGFSYGERWGLNVEDENHNSVVLPVLAFTNLELWMNGIFIANFRDIIRLNSIDVHDDDGKGRGWFIFRPEGVNTQGRRPVSAIDANIGGIARDDYNKLSSTLDLERQIASQNNISSGKITGIEFRKEHIPGIMSLLEKIGISTLDDDSDGNDDNDDSDSDGDDDDDDDDDGDDDESNGDDDDAIL